jgi:hypothetical protein
MLEAAIADGAILAERLPDTELVGVTMKHADERAAKLIVDSLMRQFENSYSYEAQRDKINTLQRLENEEQELNQKIQSTQKELRAIERELGTTAFEARAEMEMARQHALAAELSRLEVQRLGLEAKVAVLESGSDDAVASGQGQAKSSMSGFDLQVERKRYVSTDPLIQAWTRRVVDLEVDHQVTQATEPNETAALAKQAQVLATLNQRLEERCREIQNEFDVIIAYTRKEQHRTSLRRARVELEEVEAYEQRLRKVLSQQEEVQPRYVGRASLDYQRLQQDLDVDRALYDQIRRRLKLMELQLDEPPRVRIAYPAEFKGMEDDRWRLTIIVGLVGLALGLLLAVIRGPGVSVVKSP